MHSILAVDDSASMRQMVAFTLKNAGFNVVEAVDGQDAWEKSGTRDFDLVLPNVATQVEGVLMQQRPDLYRQITATVQAAALELVQRRLDLNNDVARVWALVFTEDELRQITAFYQSPAGQKLALQGQPMMQQTVDALQAWSERLPNELLERTLAQFQAQNIDF